MVNLTRIYTRTGDDGSTALGDASRTDKNDPRLVAYADVDEANSAIGVARAVRPGPDPAMDELLAWIQNDLFDVGADLCVPVVPDPPAAQLRVLPEYISRLERACDEYNAGLAPLRSFVIPGGSALAAQLHVARTVTRRAERAAWAAVAAFPGSVSLRPAQYLNRLSDLLFILARAANAEAGDVLWQPGGGTAG